jgi:hypothetical protein
MGINWNVNTKRSRISFSLAGAADRRELDLSSARAQTQPAVGTETLKATTPRLRFSPLELL